LNVCVSVNSESDYTFSLIVLGYICGLSPSECQNYTQNII